MNNQIQLVLKSSTAEMPLNDQALGIYLTPELDGLVGLPEIRTTSGVNAGYDGGWTSAQNYDARSITIRGVIANEDVATVERLRKQLVSLAGQGKSEELTLDLVTEAGNAYTLQVRTIALEMSMQSVLTQQQFMLQLRADDPLIYDAGESEHEATLQVAQATGGFTIDFELPLAITGGSEESVVNNDGLEEVPTIVKMYGALHNPKIINQTNNEQMQIMTDLGYAEGAWHTPSEASEGTNISLANTPDSAPFSDIQLKGDTTQNGTPAPSAPVAVQTVTGENVVKICGKNLFDGGAPDYTGQSAWSGYGSSGYSIVEGGYSFPNRYNAIAFEFDNLIEGEQYTFSADYVGSATFFFSVGVNMYSGGSSLPHSYRDYGAKTTEQRLSFTFTAAATNRIGINSGYTNGTTLTITNLQLELGSSASSFEPYQGQSYEVNLGKNLCDLNATFPLDINGVTVTKEADGSVTLNGTLTSNTNITLSQNNISDLKFLQGQVATLSFSTSGTGSINNIGLKQGGAAIFETSTSPKTATVNFGTKTSATWQAWCLSGTVYNNFNLKVQLELGSQATSYAAYFEPIELCKIPNTTYQDYIYKSGGKWYKHKEVDRENLNGSEDWDLAERSGSNNGVFYIDYNKIGTVGAKNNGAFSNYAHFIPGFSYLVGQFDTHYSQWRFYAPNNTITLNEWKTNLGATPLVLYYLPATPTEIEITNEALIAQLDDLLNLSRTYQGQTNMADLAASGNMPAILNVSYFTEQDPDTRDELIIDSRLHTVTLNGLDIYHLIGEGSEFLMLEPGENRLSLQSDITGDNGYAVVSYKQGYLSI